jgi:hypothetical protein
MAATCDAGARQRCDTMGRIGRYAKRFANSSDARNRPLPRRHRHSRRERHGCRRREAHNLAALESHRRGCAPDYADALRLGIQSGDGCRARRRSRRERIAPTLAAGDGRESPRVPAFRRFVCLPSPAKCCLHSPTPARCGVPPPRPGSRHECAPSDPRMVIPISQANWQ